MENMDKGLTVPKWVLKVCPKIPQMYRKYLSNAPEFICPSPKVLDFDEKKASLGVRSPWH